MKLLEVVRGEDREGRARHRDGAGQEDPEDLRRLGRVRRLHRQPHDRAVQPPGRLPAGRGLHAEQVDKAVEKFGFAMGPFRMGDPRQRRRLGTSASAAPVEKPNLRYSQDRRPAVRDGPLRPEDRRGWYDYRRQARRDPERWWKDMIAKHRAARHHAAPDLRRGDRAAPGVALVNEGRAFVEGIACGRRTSTWSTLTGYGFPLFRGGPMLRRHGGPVQRRQAMKRFAKNPNDDDAARSGSPRRCSRLAAEGDVQLKSARPAHDQRRDRLHRPRAAGQELEGPFNMTHGATLAGTPSRPSSAPASSPAESRT